MASAAVGRPTRPTLIRVSTTMPSVISSPTTVATVAGLSPVERAISLRVVSVADSTACSTSRRESLRMSRDVRLAPATVRSPRRRRRGPPSRDALHGRGRQPRSAQPHLRGTVAAHVDDQPAVVGAAAGLGVRGGVGQVAVLDPEPLAALALDRDQRPVARPLALGLAQPALDP